MANKPTFYPGAGGLATPAQDFKSHYTGTAFRHTADQIDLTSPIVINGSSYSDVEDAIAAISTSIVNEGSATSGFITTSDGYDTYHNANGTINFDKTVPSLDTLLNPIFAIITAGGTLPVSYQRIKDGGIIVIRAGTYIVKNTINIPPGITLLGEGFGTKIVNATALSFATTPPHISGTPAPVFKILPDTKRAQDDAAVDGNMFMFARETKIQNMVIGDNFIEPTILGDTTYLIPQNTSASTPLVQQEAGSSLSLVGVMFCGRVNFSSGTVVSAATSSAVKLDTTFSAPNGSILTIDKCFIDGFSVPVQFLSTGDNSDSINKDYITITNSKIRGYGYLNGDGNVTHPANNSIVVTNDSSAVISDNFIYGNADNISALLYLENHIASTPAYGARAKISVQNNNITINRANSSQNGTFQVFIPDATNYGTNYPTYVSAYIANNNFQSSGANFLTVTTATSTYTVASSDYIIIPPTASGSVTINLPSISTSATRSLIIKDPGHASSTNVITIMSNGTDVFESGPNTTYLITTPGTSLTLLAYTYNSINSWFII